jgi:hypothetical protein
MRLDGAIAAPDGPPVRVAVGAAALVALVVIGTAEAAISSGQLAELPGRARPAITGAGTTLTVVGAALSALVYAALGWLLGRSGLSGRSAIWTAAVVAFGAGLIGGGIRAYLVSDYLDGVLAGFGMQTLLVLVLGIFVSASVIVSVAAGSAIAWLSFRRSRRRAASSPPR